MKKDGVCPKLGQQFISVLESAQDILDWGILLLKWMNTLMNNMSSIDQINGNGLCPNCAGKSKYQEDIESRLREYFDIRRKRASKRYSFSVTLNLGGNSLDFENATDVLTYAKNSPKSSLSEVDNLIRRRLARCTSSRKRVSSNGRRKE